MARYFFHLHNDIDAPDEEGQEHTNDRAALEAALIEIRSLATETVALGHLNLAHFIVVVEEGGREVGVVRFGDAVKVEGALA